MSELNKSIIKIRVDLQKRNLKKSGKNKFAGFSYFELKDFLPTLNELMLENEVNDLYTIENDETILLLMKGDEVNRYSMPFERFATPLNKQGKPSMQDIQYLGALNTYYKRYLYLNAFGITDGEIIDSMPSPEEVQQKEDELKMAMKEYTTACKNRGLDTKETSKLLGLGKSTTAIQWLEAIKKLDDVKRETEVGF